MDAECLGNDQRYYPSNLPLSGIVNDDGDLKSEGIINIFDGGMLVSTFDKSCNQIKIDEVLGYVLTANCRRRDGSWNASRLDLTDIENSDGVLRYIGTNVWREASTDPVPDKQASAQGLEKTDDGYCKDYAQAAEDAQTSNLESKCGLSGARWMHNYQAHYGWCMQQTVGTAQAEFDARLKDFNNCKN